MNMKEKEIVFTSKIEKAQVELIKLMFSSDELTLKYVKQHVKSDLITIPFLKKIYEIIQDKNLLDGSSSIIEYFQDKNERDFITKMLFNNSNETSVEEIVFDCLKILKSEPLKQQISEIRVKIREKESKGQDSLKELSILTALRKELNDL